jgi:hypothetical protein
MRRYGLSAITVLSGAVACGKVWGFNDPILDESTTSIDGGHFVDTPVSPIDPTRTCVPLPPADWQGPLILYEGKGNPLPTPPNCLTGYQDKPIYEGNGEIQADPPNCHCSCDTPTAVSCAATAQFYGSNKCDSTCGNAQPITNSGSECTTLAGACGGGMRVATTATGGHCNGKLTGKDAPPAPTWQIRARVCAPLSLAQAGCAADRIGTTTAGLPFLVTYCIARSGELDCPADQYPVKHVYYEGFVDSRDCDTCTCDPPTDAKCTGSVTGLDTPANCSGGPKAYPADGGCDDIGNQKGFRYGAAVDDPGTCTPHPVTKGEATPTTATTICCTR